MLTLCTDTITPRLAYAAHELGRLLGCEVRPTEDKTALAHLSIGPSASEKTISLGNGTILTRTDVAPLNPNWGKWGDLPALFPTNEETDVPFDLLGSVFFLLSRYEEYTEPERDRHGRFPAHKSTLVKQELEHLPIVELWAARLRQLMKERFPELHFEEPAFELLPTFDIDSAFAYAHKGWWRTAGGFARDLVHRDTVNARLRWKVLMGKSSDPYDIYEWLESTLNNRGLTRKYFFLLSDFGKFNKNVTHQSAALQTLINRLGKTADVGIHPGYLTAENDDIMQNEVARLAAITGEPVRISRQHYLRMDLPDTYESLIKCGISEDHTMGFADRPGFRAGISRPFGFFNLRTNQARPLTIVPFVCMDATLRYYMRLSADEAAIRMVKMRKSLEQSKSLMVLLWHNESLSEHGPWAGWRKVIESVIEHGTGKAD